MADRLVLCGRQNLKVPPTPSSGVQPLAYTNLSVILSNSNISTARKGFLTDEIKDPSHLTLTKGNYLGDFFI